MTCIHLVRHAHAYWTPDEARPLSRQGVEASRRVTHALWPIPIAAIYASPYRRAAETVWHLARKRNLLVLTVNDLRERQLAAQVVDDFEAAVAAVWRNPDFAHPGGESNIVAQRRGVAVIELLCLQHPTGHIVAATHGNLLALILQHFDPALGYEFWRGLRMPDVYRLGIDGTGNATIMRVLEDG